jgi:hypothetical protein
VALAIELLGAGGAPQGASGTEVVDAGPQLGDSNRGLLQDLVVHNTGAGSSRSAAAGDAAPAPGSSSTMSLGISGLHLSGSLGSLSPPINYRRVEDEAKFACSQVTVVERSLHEMLVMVHRYILHPIWVSLKIETKFCPPMTSSMLSHFSCV